MPASRLTCQRDGCRKVFWASRSDTKWCSERCRYLVRSEDAKFATQILPRSGVPGVTFSRIQQRWMVAIHEDGRSRQGKSSMKYVGSRATLAEAVEFQREVLGAW